MTRVAVSHIYGLRSFRQPDYKERAILTGYIKHQNKSYRIKNLLLVGGCLLFTILNLLLDGVSKDSLFMIIPVTVLILADIAAVVHSEKINNKIIDNLKVLDCSVNDSRYTVFLPRRGITWYRRQYYATLRYPNGTIISNSVKVSKTVGVYCTDNIAKAYLVTGGDFTYLITDIDIYQYSGEII